MQCPICQRSLRIGVSYVTFKNDDTPDALTEAYTNLPMICTNPECANYGGEDLNHPTKTVEVIAHKIN